MKYGNDSNSTGPSEEREEATGGTFQNQLPSANFDAVVELVGKCQKPEDVLHNPNWKVI